MATEHGAATTPFGTTIGSLKPGSEADLVLLDHESITRPYQHAETPLIDVIVHRAKTSAIEAVMVGGEVIYENGRFLVSTARRFWRPSARASRHRSRHRSRIGGVSRRRSSRMSAHSMIAGCRKSLLRRTRITMRARRLGTAKSRRA